MDEPLTDQQLLELAAAEAPGTGKKSLSALERKFVDAYLGVAGGQAHVAAKMVGWAAPSGSEVLQRPHVQAEIARQIELAKTRIGSLQLDKERLLLDLDNALLETKAAFSKEITAYGTCPECDRRVAVTIMPGPREVASLTIATSKAVETAARIVGALAPTKVEHTGKTEGQGTYHTLVRMVKENPNAILPQQREQMIAAAQQDRADIEELLQLLIPEEVTH